MTKRNVPDATYTNPAKQPAQPTPENDIDSEAAPEIQRSFQRPTQQPLSSRSTMHLQRIIGNHQVNKLLTKQTPNVQRSSLNKPQLKPKGQPISATQSKDFLQRMRGIVANTHVKVQGQGTPLYGSLVQANDNTYDIRVGGTQDSITTAPKNQVEPVALENMLFTLGNMPVMDINQELQNFSGEGPLAQAIVQAQANMPQSPDKQVAALSIATFCYIARNAQAIVQAVAPFLRSVSDNNEKANAMIQASNLFQTKITRPILGGPDWQPYVQDNGAALLYLLQQGKQALLDKAQDAQNNNKSLVNLLEQHSTNLDAKAYGRRYESMMLLDVGGLANVGGVANATPPVNTPIAHVDITYALHNDPQDEDNYTMMVELTDMQANGLYRVYIQGKSYAVTVAANTNTHVTFQSVQPA